MYEVGQKLWFVYSQRRDTTGYEVTVEKVGRKWTTLSNRERIDRNGHADGGQYISPGTAYFSKEVYEHGILLDRKWRELQQRLTYHRPQHLTAEMIDDITNMCFYPSEMKK